MALLSKPQQVTRSQRLFQSIMTEARQLPPEEHLTSQRVKEGNVDLTGARLFLTNGDIRQKLLDHLQATGGNRTCPYRNGHLLYHVVVRLLLQALSHAHAVWATRSLLTPTQIASHGEAIGRFRDAWKGLGWKPTVWVHWACAHAGYFVTTYRTIFGFSSIPTEHRHQKFKRDLRNTCSAFKFRNPLRCKGYLKRCVEMDALDQGLRLLKVRKLDTSVNIFPNTRSGEKP